MPNQISTRSCGVPAAAVPADLVGHRRDHRDDDEGNLEEVDEQPRMKISTLTTIRKPSAPPGMFLNSSSTQ